MKRSNISWTDFSGGDANFVLRGRNPGDCEVSRGCANCYAGAILRRSSATHEYTVWSEAKLKRLARAKFAPGDNPFRRGAGSRPLVFVCDMGDLFHESVPVDFIVNALDTMSVRTDVEWQVLTKRPGRMVEVLSVRGCWPDNVWAGTTVEDQRAANWRIPLLLEIPARVRFLSMEPLLEHVDLLNVPTVENKVFWTTGGIQWVIVGGESGPRRRVFSVEWAHNLRNQCAAAGVAFFYKQGSDRFPGRDDTLDGVTHKEFPGYRPFEGTK